GRGWPSSSLPHAPPPGLGGSREHVSRHARDRTPVVNLANTAVFLDFDGTISEADVGVHLLDRLGDPDWRQVEDLYFSGAIGNLDRCCPCSTCGTCKQAPIKDAQRRGRQALFVGDGASDRKAALLADVLFAKGELADWCEEVDVAYTRFERLRDVGLALGLRQ